MKTSSIQNQTSINYLETLPDETLCYVFSFLKGEQVFNNLCLTSKRFKALAHDRFCLIQLFEEIYPNSVAKIKNNELSEELFLKQVAFEKKQQAFDKWLKQNFILKSFSCFEAKKYIPSDSNGSQIVFLNSNGLIQINNLDKKKLCTFKAQEDVREIITIKEIIFTISPHEINSWDFEGNSIKKRQIRYELNLSDKKSVVIRGSNLIARSGSYILFIDFKLEKIKKIKNSDRIFPHHNFIKKFDNKSINVSDLKGHVVNLKMFPEYSAILELKFAEDKYIGGLIDGSIVIWDSEGHFLHRFRVFDKQVQNFEIVHGRIISKGRDFGPKNELVYSIKISDFDGKLLHTFNHKFFVAKPDHRIYLPECLKVIDGSIIFSINSNLEILTPSKPESNCLIM